MRLRTLLPAIVIAVLAGGMPAVAHAGRLTVGTQNGTLTFVGDSRADDLTVSYGKTGSTVTFSDPSIPIGMDAIATAGFGCAAAEKSRHTVECRPVVVPLHELSVELATGNDRVQIAGGAGDHTPPLETLHGGAGDDVLIGGRGVTSFLQEPGNDRMTGGGGSDKIFYLSAGGVTVTLDGLANDGAFGEADNVGSDIEQVLGGSGPDRLTAAPGGSELTGGPGNDVLAGGPGPDKLAPDEGRDQVTGGAGEDEVLYCCGPFNVSLDGQANDGRIGLDEHDIIATDVEDIHTLGVDQQSILTGGPGPNRFTVDEGNAVVAGLSGDDTLVADTGPDSFSGGGGFDTISYAGRTSQFSRGAVTVTIDDVANDGRAGENDNVETDVEHVIGTPDDDHLTGSPAPDTLDGGDGGDSIDGGAGVDDLRGGAGDDTIRARDPLPTAFADHVECGDGADDIAVLDLTDPIPADCENIAQAAIDQGPGLQIAHRALRFDHRGVIRLRLACPRAEAAGCRGRLQLARRGHAALARARYRLTAGRRTTLPLKVRRHPPRGARLRVTARENDPHGRPKLTIATLKVARR